MAFERYQLLSVNCSGYRLESCLFANGGVNNDRRLSIDCVYAIIICRHNKSAATLTFNNKLI